jgi:hypothetical protein
VLAGAAAESDSDEQQQLASTARLCDTRAVRSNACTADTFYAGKTLEGTHHVFQ